jgi:hypothetical protein
MHFFTFTHVRQTCFACNFFLVPFFTAFSGDLGSAWGSAFFDAFFDFCRRIFFGAILVFFSNFEAGRAGDGSINQKSYLVDVSWISVLHPSKGLYSLFSKKKSNSLYPIIHIPFFNTYNLFIFI